MDHADHEYRPDCGDPDHGSARRDAQAIRLENYDDTWDSWSHRALWYLCPLSRKPTADCDCAGSARYLLRVLLRHRLYLHRCRLSERCSDERTRLVQPAHSGARRPRGKVDVYPASGEPHARQRRGLQIAVPRPDFHVYRRSHSARGGIPSAAGGTTCYGWNPSHCSLKKTAIVASLLSLAAIANAGPFKDQTIDDKIQIGYRLAIADVNGDNKTDVLLVDKAQVVWYENPSWEKHVIAEKLTAIDHVCIAAQDIDGDGKAEIAVGAGWNPGDTLNSGAVFYLVPPADRKQMWRPVELHHEPTVHRMWWVNDESGKYTLVVAPLHGRGNKNGAG